MNIIFILLFAFTDSKKVLSKHLNEPKKYDLDFATQITDTLSNRSNLFVFHNADQSINDGNEDTDKMNIFDNHSNDSESYEDPTLSEEEILENKQIYEEILDNMSTKITEGQNRLPIFLEEPQSTYIIKNQAATLTCKAAYALQISFKCRGRNQSPPSIFEHHVDPHSGILLQEVTATITRDLVDEFFGTFQCECQAWSSSGSSKSQPATVMVAYLKKHFGVTSPSIRVELGSRVQLDCNAPSGLPIPIITWHKNGQTLKFDERVSKTIVASVLIPVTQLEDLGNYTCIAENIAGKRISPDIQVTLYVNGGWSAWGPWLNCRCLNKYSQGQKRSRSCTNPEPLNNGSFCIGPNIQKTKDCVVCSGRWSDWSEWSVCSKNCTQTKIRTCENDNLSNSTLLSECYGKRIQIIECRGGECTIDQEDNMWLVYMLITTVVVVLFIVFGKLFAHKNQRGNQYPAYGSTQLDMDSEYYSDNKKKTETFQSDVTHNLSSTYEYPTRELATRQLKSNMPHEPHYDIPHLSNSYTSPLDKISNHSLNASSLNTKKNYSIDSATASTLSDSVYYAISEPSTLPISSKLEIGKVTSTCGSILTMEKKYGVALLIPENRENVLEINKKLLLSLLKNENFEWSSASIVSPFVCINEMDNTLKLRRPVILRIPHCMLDIKRWKISLYFSKNSIENETNRQWHKLTTVNEEDINTPVFLQIEKNFINISTETIGKFVLVGSSVNPNSMPACKNMKLLFFSLMQSNGSFLSRVYIVNNFRDSIEDCMNYEREHGATFLGHKAISFFENQKDLIVQLKYAQSNYQTNTVSFGNIWHCSTNTRLLHCDFTINLNQFPIDANCSNMKVIAYQHHKDDDNSIYSIIPLKTRTNTLLLEEIHSNPQLPSCSQLIVTQHHSVSVPLIDSINRMDLEGRNYSIAGNFKIFTLLLTKVIRKQICYKLDPPTERGNDWRLFARKLNADRYLPYFASRASPTNVLLDFWELENWCNGSKSLLDLIQIFVSMDREDVAAIIENEKFPTWI